MTLIEAKEIIDEMIDRKDTKTYPQGLDYREISALAILSSLVRDVLRLPR